MGQFIAGAQRALVAPVVYHSVTNLDFHQPPENVRGALVTCSGVPYLDPFRMFAHSIRFPAIGSVQASLAAGNFTNEAAFMVMGFCAPVQRVHQNAPLRMMFGKRVKDYVDGKDPKRATGEAAVVVAAAGAVEARAPVTAAAAVATGAAPALPGGGLGPV